LAAAWSPGAASASHATWRPRLPFWSPTRPSSSLARSSTWTAAPPPAWACGGTRATRACDRSQAQIGSSLVQRVNLPAACAWASRARVSRHSFAHTRQSGLALAVAARDDAQAAIVGGGIGQGQPDGKHVGVIRLGKVHALVLMPIRSGQQRRALQMLRQLAFRRLDARVLDGIRVDLTADEVL